MQSQGLEGRVSGRVTGALSRWREGPSPPPAFQVLEKARVDSPLEPPA